VCEFVPSALEFIAGEIWSGDGSADVYRRFGIQRLARLPIVGRCGTTAFKLFVPATSSQRPIVRCLRNIPVLGLRR